MDIIKALDAAQIGTALLIIAVLLFLIVLDKDRKASKNKSK